MSARPRLHVPRAPARPGEAPDFAYLKISPAGAVGRPAVEAAAKDLSDCSDPMVRVLDEQHMATGPWDPELDDETLRAALRHMLLTRIFDERMQRMQRQGEISFYVSSRGEEAVSVGAAMALPQEDMLFPSYRNQGVHFARGRAPVELMCQCLSNVGDMCKGRQLPTLYHWKEGNIFSISGNLATQFPHAVGWAMASSILGEDTVAAAWIGEGSSAEADFHHGLTFAAVYRAPVILMVVNNQWAISTFQGLAGGEERSFSARGPGYGIPSFRVDGNDVLAVYAVTRWARERARAGYGPTLVEQVTYRAGPHSTSDDPSRYRPRDDYAHWPLGDPVERLKRHLIEGGRWDETRHEALQTELTELIGAHWTKARDCGTADHGPRLDSALIFEDVYRELPDHLRSQQGELQRIKDGT